MGINTDIKLCYNYAGTMPGCPKNFYYDTASEEIITGKSEIMFKPIDSTSDIVIQFLHPIILIMVRMNDKPWDYEITAVYDCNTNHVGYPAANHLPNNTLIKYESILCELVKCQFDKSHMISSGFTTME